MSTELITDAKPQVPQADAPSGGVFNIPEATPVLYNFSKEFYAQYGDLLPQGTGRVALLGANQDGTEFVTVTDESTDTDSVASLVFDASRHEQGLYFWEATLARRGAGRTSRLVGATAFGISGMRVEFDSQGRAGSPEPIPSSEIYEVVADIHELTGSLSSQAKVDSLRAGQQAAREELEEIATGDKFFGEIKSAKLATLRKRIAENGFQPTRIDIKKYWSELENRDELVNL